MPKLTKNQKNLILWSAEEGNHLEVCSDYVPSRGEILPKSGLPCRVFSGTIDKLFQAGLINYVPVFHHGIRWDKFSLTKKGKEVACSLA